MEQFKLRQNGIKEIIKAQLIKALLILLLIVFGAVAIFYFNSNGQQFSINGFMFSLSLVLSSFALGLYFSFNIQKKIFGSYVLTLNNNEITREQHNTPTITISIPAISEIIKNQNGGFTIKGNSNVISVPAQINDYQKLEKLLSQITQISTKTNQTFQILLSIFTVGLSAAFYLSKHKIIVRVSGTVLLLIMGYSFFEIQKSKNIDSKSKKIMWLLIFGIAFIVNVMYKKLTI